MAKNLILIALLITVIFLTYYLFFSGTNTPLNTINITIKNKKYSLEIAKSSSQQSRGLSNRTSLCPDCGMIFPYPFNTILPFWMKDTLIPLDMIWINSQGSIVKILTVQPQPNTPSTSVTVYKNEAPAKYVIELNAGDAKKLDLNVGDLINLNNL